MSSFCLSVFNSVLFFLLLFSPCYKFFHYSSRHALLTYKVLLWVQSSKILAPLRVILKFYKS
jgi:hypothetical protein